MHLIVIGQELLDLRESAYDGNICDVIPPTVEDSKILQVGTSLRNLADLVAYDDEMVELRQLAKLFRELRNGVEGHVEVDEGNDLTNSSGDMLELVVGDVEIAKGAEAREIIWEVLHPVVL